MRSERRAGPGGFGSDYLLVTCGHGGNRVPAALAAHFRGRQRVIGRHPRASAGQRVIHISSHSFTPVLDGTARTADVGLLYDPPRSGERALAAHWQAAFAAQAPGLRVRRNYPYEGKDDGLTAALRRACSPAQYVGIELEVSQRFVLAGRAPWRALRALVVATLRAALGSDAGAAPQFMPPPAPRSPQ